MNKKVGSVDTLIEPIMEIDIEGAAEGYLEILNRYDVDYVICSPGSEFVPIWEYLAKFKAQGRKPKYLNARHEGLAIAMAKGYTMITRKPQVVLLHVTSGLLHGAMEIKALHTEKVPMLIIVGQNISHEDEIRGGTAGPHYFPFTEVGGSQRLVQPYVKWCDAPDTNLNINFILARAFRVTMSEPKGPVFLLISRELMFEKINRMKIPEKIYPSTSIQADPNALEILAECLVEADNPIIYTRCLGRNPNTVEYLVKLADILSIPVLETPAYMNFPTNHPLHLGYDISPHLNDVDLILVIDSSGRPPWYPPSKVLKESRAKIVFMDIDPAQINYPYWGFPADMLITADSSLAMPALLETVKSKVWYNQDFDIKIEERRSRWKSEHDKQRKKWEEEALLVKDEVPIDPKWLCYNIDNIIEENFIIIHETITSSGVINRYVEKNRVKPGNRFEGAGGAAHTGLGQGLSVALGVKLARPEKTVVALEGDGSFNYNPVNACFGLAQEYNLPFLTVIFDNQSYAAMKRHNRYYPNGWSLRTDTYYGVYKEPKPDYVKLTEAFDGYAEKITEPSEVKPALLRALNQVAKGRLALCDMILKRP